MRERVVLDLSQHMRVGIRKISLKPFKMLLLFALGSMEPPPPSFSYGHPYHNCDTGCTVRKTEPLRAAIIHDGVGSKDATGVPELGLCLVVCILNGVFQAVIPIQCESLNYPKRSGMSCTAFHTAGFPDYLQEFFKIRL